VSFTDALKLHLAVKRFDYSEVLRFVLAPRGSSMVDPFEIRRPSAENDRFRRPLNQQRLRRMPLLPFPLRRQSWL
jgi:hypothetical protein